MRWEEMDDDGKGRVDRLTLHGQSSLYLFLLAELFSVRHHHFLVFSLFHLYPPFPCLFFLIVEGEVRSKKYKENEYTALTLPILFHLVVSLFLSFSLLIMMKTTKWS